MQPPRERSHPLVPSERITLSETREQRGINGALVTRRCRAERLEVPAIRAVVCSGELQKISRLSFKGTPRSDSATSRRTPRGKHPPTGGAPPRARSPSPCAARGTRRYALGGPVRKLQFNFANTRRPQLRQQPDRPRAVVRVGIRQHASSPRWPRRCPPSSARRSRSLER